MSEFNIDMSEVLALAASLDLKDTTVAPKADAAVRYAAQVTKERAQQMAPVRTGALRESLRITGSRLTRRVTAKTPYSMYVEFGTTTQAPQPFLYPAGDKGEEVLIQLLADIAEERL